MLMLILPGRSAKEPNGLKDLLPTHRLIATQTDAPFLHRHTNPSPTRFASSPPLKHLHSPLFDATQRQLSSMGESIKRRTLKLGGYENGGGDEQGVLDLNAERGFADFGGDGGFHVGGCREVDGDV